MFSVNIVIIFDVKIFNILSKWYLIFFLFHGQKNAEFGGENILSNVSRCQISQMWKIIEVPLETILDSELRKMHFVPSFVTITALESIT